MTETTKLDLAKGRKGSKIVANRFDVEIAQRIVAMNELYLSAITLDGNPSADQLAKSAILEYPFIMFDVAIPDSARSIPASRSRTNEMLGLLAHAYISMFQEVARAEGELYARLTFEVSSSQAQRIMAIDPARAFYIARIINNGDFATKKKALQLQRYIRNAAGPGTPPGTVWITGMLSMLARGE